MNTEANTGEVIAAIRQEIARIKSFPKVIDEVSEAVARMEKHLCKCDGASPSQCSHFLGLVHDEAVRVSSIGSARQIDECLHAIAAVARYELDVRPPARREASRFQ